MKTLQLADLPAALADLEAELGAIEERLVQICAALPEPDFDHADRPQNAAARILRMLESGRQEDLELLTTRLRVARVQTQRLMPEKVEP